MADIKQIQRPTLRGLRKCSVCGAINGNRALLCRNLACPQSKNVLDGVQLLCRRAGFSVYSLRTKDREREAPPRNFVCIEDVTLSLQPNAAVVSSKAICYVDACKRDSNCGHIKACRENSKRMPQAQVYSVSREVLWNLNIGQEQKQHLWKQYKLAEEQEQLPAVQRINATTFVVKCERSDTFPAARLHVTALANGLSTKKGTYACACRKLKIIVEPDNSLVMQDEICDHLLLVLGGILSSPQGKTIYGNFTKSLQSFWMPAKLETPLGEVTHDDLCLSLSINISGEADPIEDIYIFGDECLQTDTDLLPLREDLSDVIYDVDSTPVQNSGSSSAVVRYANDAQLLSNYDIYTEQQDQHLELTDCNIELMDEYQLTDQIDLCSDDIELPFVSEPYNILAPPPIFTKAPPAATNQLPAIELPTIAVVKKSAIKANEIVNEVKTRKQPPLPAKRALIVNDTAAVVEAVDVTVEPALSYAAWLDYVIELLNDTVEPAPDAEQLVSTRSVHQSFHVHKETFSHFCKSFSAGIKRRPLHQVSVIEVGKHKGLTKYVWHFSASHTVKRIFSSPNLCLQLERCFEHHVDGYFVPYVRQTHTPSAAQSKQRVVYAKLRLYMVNMMFEAGNKASGLLLTWIPDVLSRSNFGLMSVDFSLQTRAPPSM